MVRQEGLHQTVTDIAEDYFGPAAPRFMTRLIVNHIGKEPEDLKPKDMHELADWAQATASLLTDDQMLVDEFVGRLKGAARK